MGQLANNTSGYASFYTDAWTEAFHADPFRVWTPAQMIALGADQPLTFTPGTNRAFSDTNFTILGQVIQKAGKASVQSQIDKEILEPLHLKNTHLITWSKALGTGTLLSSKSHARQIAPDTAGLGPLTADK